MTTILSPLPASEQMTHHPDTRFHHLAEDAVKPLPLDMPWMAHSLDDTFSSSSSEPTTNADSKDSSSSLDSSFELACQDVKLACHDDAATVNALKMTTRTSGLAATTNSSRTHNCKFLALFGHPITHLNSN
ncbi:hypothetical protein CAOG_009813 [Capsaspora owczarzaki ATCC 30864]|uniref:Uncharacterized protein n=1 Tax=Capsaspora owczarzaki (strain ATCC 30864) TaxID=595528 RepID=A0A0D2UGY9_CAPO3|nr:hypothetical protein CAOG_009813 [Capsaspora owczarzaki ATCC 30864]